jgi:hypothetical protein
VQIGACGVGVDSFVHELHGVVVVPACEIFHGVEVEARAVRLGWVRLK